jgi:negative regulator of genetic competence, sporulation and motility
MNENEKQKTKTKSKKKEEKKEEKKKEEKKKKRRKEKRPKEKKRKKEKKKKRKNTFILLRGEIISRVLDFSTNHKLTLHQLLNSTLHSLLCTHLSITNRFDLVTG